MLLVDASQSEDLSRPSHTAATPQQQKPREEMTGNVGRVYSTHQELNKISFSCIFHTSASRQPTAPQELV